MAKIIIYGSKGRMGQVVIACAESTDGFEVIDAIDIGDDLASVIAGCDAVIDFSFHEATPSAAALCAEHKKPLIIGTT
ncbi:uncharacterized protein METZ01_LOCUS483090, partial [marine metagenome]